METRPIFYPNVTQIPGSGQQPKTEERAKAPGEVSEFDRVLDQTATGPSKALDQASTGLKFSAHASQRMKERRIHFDPAMMTKVSEAVNKAESKGLEDTLVLTKDAALIVNVPNRTVVTALDRAQLTGNVFTNIDGAIVI